MPTAMPTTASEGDDVLSEIISDAIGDTQALERIRPDLNIEKWSIWQPAKSKLAPSVRAFEREVILPDGSKLTAHVKIGFTDEGTLTTEHQKAYWALVKTWEDEGCPVEEDTHLYLRQFVRTLKKGWGTNTRDRAIQCLLGLRSVPFTWLNSYHNAATGKTVDKLTRFTILSKLEIFSRKDNPESYHGVAAFRFDENILDCLSNNYTKPLLFDTAISFKSEIAQLLYPHVDLVMADKYKYERRTEGLFEDLGLKGKRYVYPSVRKQVLEPALKEMEGKLLSTGVLVKATLERTKDGKDWKAVFVKKAIRKKKKSNVVQRDTERSVRQPTEQPETSFVHGLYERGIRPEAKASELVERNSAEQVKQWVEIYDLGLVQIGGLRDALEQGWQPSHAQLNAVGKTKTKAAHEKVSELNREKEKIKEAHAEKCEVIFQEIIGKYPKEVEEALRAGVESSRLASWYDESKPFAEQSMMVQTLARPALRERFFNLFKVVDDEYERQVKEIEKRSEEIRVG